MTDVELRQRIGGLIRERPFSARHGAQFYEEALTIHAYLAPPPGKSPFDPVYEPIFCGSFDAGSTGPLPRLDLLIRVTPVVPTAGAYGDELVGGHTPLPEDHHDTQASAEANERAKWSRRRLRSPRIHSANLTGLKLRVSVLAANQVLEEREATVDENGVGRVEDVPIDSQCELSVVPAASEIKFVPRRAPIFGFLGGVLHHPRRLAVCLALATLSIGVYFVAKPLRPPVPEIASLRSDGSPGGWLMGETSLRDGFSGRIMRSAWSRLSLEGSGPLPKDLETLVSDLVERGRVELAATVRETVSRVQQNPVLLGNSTEDSSRPAPIHPVGVLIPTNRPTFKWRGVGGARTYSIVLTTEAGADVWKGETSEMEVTLPASSPGLPRGSVFVWQVEAAVSGSTQRSTPAFFFVLGSAEADYISSLERRFGQSALIMAAVYASYGMRDQASEALAKLEKLNPDNPALDRLKLAILPADR